MCEMLTIVIKFHPQFSRNSEKFHCEKKVEKSFCFECVGDELTKKFICRSKAESGEIFQVLMCW